MQEYNRDDLVRLTPDIYLADGYLDAAGGPRPELKGVWASAATAQLMAAELSPQELGFTVDAIKLLLPERDEADPRARLDGAIREALQVVARATQQKNNQGLVEWLGLCAAPVKTEADIQAFMEHLEAVRTQYALLVALMPSEPPSPSSSSPGPA